MRLHSPRFEQKLRRAVRRTVRASLQLKRDFRIVNRRRKHYSLGIFARPALALVLPMVVWRLSDEGQTIQAPLAVIALWAFGLVFFQAGSLLAFLYSASDLPALSVLPVDGSTIFRWEFQKFLRRSCWLFVDVLLSCSVLGVLHHFSAMRWLAVVPVALLAWLTSLSLAALFAARWPGFPYPLISLVLWILVIAALVLRSVVGPMLLELLHQCAPWILLILPTGWPVSLLEALLDSQRSLNFSLLVPIALVVVTIKSSLARLRSHYEFTETTQPEPPDLIPDIETESPAVGAAGAFPRRAGLTEIEEIVRTRQFLAEPRWQERGWFERRLWRWLNAREKILADMVFPDGPVLSVAWKKVFRTLLAGMMATLLAGQFSPALKGWVLGGSLFIAACQAVALLFAVGMAFRSVPCGGVHIPFHAGFPVGFRELARLLVKYSAAQLPLLILSAAFGGAMVASILAQAPWTTGLVFGIKIACLVFALRFVAIVLTVSAVTNDTARFRIRTVALVVAMVVAAVAFLALAGAGLAIPHPVPAWLGVLFACLVCFGSFRLYAWFYDANRFDLMNVPRQ